MPETAAESLLTGIDSPDDLRRLKVEQLPQLAEELRTFVIDVVSRTGGHLGSNLGAIELTLALHYVYDTPRDLIVWDVGAQAYAHKILTGRRSRFNTNRQYGGIAGFPRRAESPYDTFGVGHSSTSISAALGMAVARDLSGQSHKVIAVIGDGGMTGGLAFEGLNNAGSEGRDITVVLNDNRMAISPNVGALSRHISSLRADPRFERLKDSMWQLAGQLPRGSQLRKALGGVDAGIRAMLVPGLWFERLGFRYVGPIDGHDTGELVKMFSWLKAIQGPVLVHVLTEKGKGYHHAENDGLRLHGVSKFDPEFGPVAASGELTFAGHFSDELLKVAHEDEKVVAITPAMIEGSALGQFQAEFPERCFDVGIAEQHAVTFAAGLAAQGYKPVVAIYSTFFQRAYDQLIHDVALQELPVVFGVDRAGIVGEDGPTHHGAFDLSYLRAIPEVRILIPRDSDQMRAMLRFVLLKDDHATAIRFPRGKSLRFDPPVRPETDLTRPEMLRDGTDGLIVGCGIILREALDAALDLVNEELLNLAVVDLRCLKPLDTETLREFSQRFSKWLTIEENTLEGGMGSALIEHITDHQLPIEICRMGLPDKFIAHGDRASLLRDTGIDRAAIRKTALGFFARRTVRPRRRVGLFRL